ncbi:hypothetical protein HHK36_009945 [Tetracentron sinense]|uniref:Autophagy-related protein 2 n=1 Tax=Tetracentron sinense TaxID=13715 RepID=A0A835DI01_TETSI|nr:hypothetical protein HHK36_009945 [Tetracentron sinense]
MFPWNIAKSAEGMFSRRAIKHICKFLLKKKLGQFILGDIDLDQLDVQLGAGTIQLNDLALNVDYLNQKVRAICFSSGQSTPTHFAICKEDELGAAAVIVKEGSIGSLLVKIPWKGKSCQIEVDELELVLGPCAGNNLPAGAETLISSQDGKQRVSHGLEKPEHEMVNNDTTSVSLDVHEGVKTIAKMVKWLLTSFHVKIKKLIVAFDPCSEKDEKRSGSHTSLVLRITETECGTSISEDASSNNDARVESFLGMSQLTNFVKFQGAIVELLQMDDVDNQSRVPGVSGTTFSEWYFGSCPVNSTTPILTGENGGFSGTLKVSIPWKNGSLDVCKVDTDVSIDPVELRFQPSTVKWFICLWESLKNLGKHDRSHMHYKATDSMYFSSASQCHSSSISSAVIATDSMMPNSENSSAGFCTLMCREPVTDALLPGSHLIPDWVTLSINKSQKERAGAEPDFGASIDQFFECIDGMRNSQSALSNSGIWNWTSSVFSAITAASSLASGSLHVPSEQQHVETNLKATVAGISVVFSFHNEDQKHSCDLKGDHTNLGLNAHYLGPQICPREMKFEAMVKHIELDDYFNNGNEVLDFGLLGLENNIHGQSHLIQHLQAEVQGALPSFPSSGMASMNDGISGINCRTILNDDLVKVKLLETSSHCKITVKSSSSDDSLMGSTSFFLELPPFVFWVNFHLVNMLLDLLKQVGNSFEVNSINKCFGSKPSSEKHDSSCHGDVKRGTCPYITTLPPKGSLRGSIFVPNARVILCFPFENHGDYGHYSSWNQFIALDISAPYSKEKVRGVYQIPDASSQKGNYSTASHSIYLNIGDLDIYLLTSSWKDDVGSNSYAIQRQPFSAQKIVSVTNVPGCLSGISMFWQDGPVTGPWIAEKARSLATQDSSRDKVTGKGYEFAFVTTVKDLEDTNFCTRQEMILSSAFFLQVRLSSVWINLHNSQYKDVHRLLSQVMDGLSCVACDTKAIPSVNEESSASQTSVLLESDSVEISISVDMTEDIKSSIQKELPGSWHNLKLKLQKFEFLSVSDIGGIRGANFVWVGHGEGKLWGSITGVPDQELLLISCSNSTMKRGDGEGANALSSCFAGSAIVHLWDPQSFQSFTSIAVRCGTIVAPGGRLDWLNAISFFFSLPCPENEQAGNNSSQKGFSEDGGSYEASFVLNLVDVALSYEPHIKNLVVSGVLEPTFNRSAELNEETREQYVACLLAAASLNLSNKTVTDSMENEYKIRLQDLGLLLCALSGSENASGMYSVEYLHKIGYVKVAGEALVEAILRTNCKSGLLWEVECSESHINLDTCQDTTTGLIRLAAQLQQLFAPDVEESVVHLQSRWNNFQQAQDRHEIINETKISVTDSASSSSHVHASGVDADNISGVVGLMDEVCEDAFHLNGNCTSPSDSCESQFRISLDGGLFGDAYNFGMGTPETLSHNLSFNESTPGIGLESTQTSFLQKDCFPEFIESYCLSDLRPLSDFSISSQSLNHNLKCKSRNVGNRDGGSGNSGWYGDTSLRIVENHISKVSNQPGGKQLLGEGKLPSINCTRPDDFCMVKGRVLIKNIDVRWRMYAGSDWHATRKNVQNAANSGGRDATECLELLLSGMDLQYDIFPDGEICVSKLSLSVQDFHLYDSSKNAPWKFGHLKLLICLILKVLGCYHSKDHPRESSAKAFKLDLEAVRPDPSTPLEEYRYEGDNFFLIL